MRAQTKLVREGFFVKNAALLVALVALVVAVYARWRRGRAADARATAEEGAR